MDWDRDIPDEYAFLRKLRHLMGARSRQVPDPDASYRLTDTPRHFNTGTSAASNHLELMRQKMQPELFRSLGDTIGKHETPGPNSWYSTENISGLENLYEKIVRDKALARELAVRDLDYRIGKERTGHTLSNVFGTPGKWKM